MLSPDSLFGKLFDEIKITPSRLSDFTGDTLSRFAAANGSGLYTDIITDLTALYTPFKGEIDGVDTGVNIQRGKTQTNNEVMAEFAHTMSTKMGVIADDLGGEGRPAFLEFYPHGTSEYTDATKVQMPTLVNRIFTAATAHATALGTPLATLLKSYKAMWETSRDEQEEQKGTVTDSRTQRSEFRTSLELGLTKVIHTVGMMYPGDVETCSQFFDFTRLYPAGHRTHQRFNLTITPLGIALVLNHTLTESVRVHVNNQSFGADVTCYLAHTNGEQPDGDGVTVKAEHGANAGASKLGSLANTFLLIKNLSDVNTATCEVDVVGLSD